MRFFVIGAGTDDAYRVRLRHAGLPVHRSCHIYHRTTAAHRAGATGGVADEQHPGKLGLAAAVQIPLPQAGIRDRGIHRDDPGRLHRRHHAVPDNQRRHGADHVVHAVRVGLYGIVYIATFAADKRSFDREYWRFSFSYSLAVVLHALSQIILNSSAKILIDKLCGRAEAAYYGVTYSAAMCSTSS